MIDFELKKLRDLQTLVFNCFTLVQSFSNTIPTVTYKLEGKVYKLYNDITRMYQYCIEHNQPYGTSVGVQTSRPIRITEETQTSHPFVRRGRPRTFGTQT